MTEWELLISMQRIALTFLANGDVCATKSFVELLAEDPQDVRANVFLAPSADKKKVFNGAKVYLNKMPAYNGDVRYSNIPLLRLSEVYLNAAEDSF